MRFEGILTKNENFSYNQAYQNPCIIMIDPYNKQYCDALELTYGDGMMSEGGPECIEAMVKDIDLEGKSVLDFGSGLGGIVLYLANKYNVHITGLDVSKRMIEEACQKIPTHLKDKVSFVLNQDEHTLQFEDNVFDVILSKGVIVHLTNAQHESMFKEFNRILKPGGILLIHDWLSKEDGKWGRGMEFIMDSEGLYLNPISAHTYQNLLLNAGFTNIQYLDKSDMYSKSNKAIVDRLESPEIKHEFIQRFGHSIWQDHRDGYQLIADTFERKESISAEFKAIKNSHNQTYK